MYFPTIVMTLPVDRFGQNETQKMDGLTATLISAATDVHSYGLLAIMGRLELPDRKKGDNCRKK